ncbi:tyrosine-type recombinase/integrase [Ureibacillus sp. FSL K6-0165]|uniref:tyrosine-type recombinase/integrase n=1 Tax=Ureibacillus sp. FSL K6-0165 TaxID=2954606 RepID=UPI0030F77412
MWEYKIEKINIEVCQKHVNSWAEKLKKFRTVKSYTAKVLDFAIKRGYIQSNPFDYVDMPKKIKREYNFVNQNKVENYYTREQLVAFLTCLEKENDYKLFAFFRLLAFTGMRKGEAFALTWDDINFKAHEITINKAISRGKDNKLYLKSTKKGDTRTIKIDDKTMAVLTEWKKIQKQEYLKLGFNTTKTNQLVFSNTENQFVQPSKTHDWFKKILKKYNLPNINSSWFSSYS